MEQLTPDKKTLIRSTSLAILRNGPAFADWLKLKRQTDPEYGFLFGGIGTQYFNWCLENSEHTKRDDHQLSAEGNSSTSMVDSMVRGPTDSVDSTRRSRSRSHSRSLSLQRESLKDTRRSASRSRDRSEDRKREDWVRKRRQERLSRGMSSRCARSRSRSSYQRREYALPRRSRRDDVWAIDKARTRRRSDEGEVRHGKLYAWSDDEKTSRVPAKPSSGESELLRQKLTQMKQKLTESATCGA